MYFCVEEEFLDIITALEAATSLSKHMGLDVAVLRDLSVRPRRSVAKNCQHLVIEVVRHPRDDFYGTV